MSEKNRFTTSDEEVAALLEYDPLAHAEQLTGESYKDSQSTMALGFGLLQGSAAAKNAALIERGDTVLSNDLDRYEQIIGEYGFRKVLEIPFATGERQERFFVWFHAPFGLLLSFDTYQGDHVNGGKVRYNWRPSDECQDRWKCTSSGHFRKDGIWVGDHDCREALIFNLERLRKNGTFVSPWVEQPFMWLLHHGDTKAQDYDHVAISKERLGMLPPDVQEVVCV